MSEQMKTREEIIRFLITRKQEMADRFSVQRIGLFGSFARGSVLEESDVDILVELKQPTFDHYMELKFFVEDHIGRTVDLVLADSLKPRLRDIIIKEVIYA